MAALLAILGLEEPLPPAPSPRRGGGVQGSFVLALLLVPPNLPSLNTPFPLREGGRGVRFWPTPSPPLQTCRIDPFPAPDLALILPASGLDLPTCEALDGKRISVRAKLLWSSLAEAHIVYGVENERVEVSLRLPKAGPDLVGRTVVVEATLRVVRHPPRGKRAAFTEVRLTEAVLLGR